MGLRVPLSRAANWASSIVSSGTSAGSTPDITKSISGSSSQTAAVCSTSSSTARRRSPLAGSRKYRQSVPLPKSRSPAGPPGPSDPPPARPGSAKPPGRRRDRLLDQPRGDARPRTFDARARARQLGQGALVAHLHARALEHREPGAVQPPKRLLVQDAIAERHPSASGVPPPRCPQPSRPSCRRSHVVPRYRTPCPRRDVRRRSRVAARTTAVTRSSMDRVAPGFGLARLRDPLTPGSRRPKWRRTCP